MSKFLFYRANGMTQFWCPKFPYFLMAFFGGLLPAKTAQRWFAIHDICDRYGRNPSYFESVKWNMADNSSHV